MKKLLLSSLLMVMSIRATENIENAIINSDYARVKSYLNTTSLDEETKARLVDMCNDVINKRTAKTAVNHEVEDASNDLKRHARSSLLMTLGGTICAGAVAITYKIREDARSYRDTRDANLLGLTGIAIGSCIALKGLVNFFQSLTLNNSKPLEKKRFIKLKNAILVKQLILKA